MSNVFDQFDAPADSGNPFDQFDHKQVAEPAAHDRFQWWPERVLRGIGSAIVSGATAPRDAMSGKLQVTDPETGMPTREAIERAGDVAGIIAGGQARPSYKRLPKPDVPPVAQVDATSGPSAAERLLSPETPHEFSGRASVGAAGSTDPLAGYSPETIAKVRGDMQQAFPTEHLLEQALDERSAHHTLGELSPDLEAKMGGLATGTGPERAEIVSSLTQRSHEGKDRMRAVFDRELGPAQNRFEMTQALKEEQARESKPFWDRFKATEITPTPELNALMPRLEAAGALRAANKALRIEGLPLTSGFPIAEDSVLAEAAETMPTATAFQYAKEHLDDLIEKAISTPGEANAARRYTQLKNDLVNAIDRHPDQGIAGLWRAAREVYAPPSQVQKAMRLGERVMTGHVHADELPSLTASMGPREIEAMRVGMRGYLEDMFGKPGKTERRTINTVLAPSNQRKIAWAIGDEAASRLVAAVEHEQSMLDAPNRIYGNSATAARTQAKQEWHDPEQGLLGKLGDVSVADIAGAVRHPARTVGKAAAKAGLNRMAAKRAAALAKVREEAARLYTLQGPERDAVARALLQGRTGTAAPIAAPVSAAGPPSRLKRLAVAATIPAAGYGLYDYMSQPQHPLTVGARLPQGVPPKDQRPVGFVYTDQQGKRHKWDGERWQG